MKKALLLALAALALGTQSPASAQEAVKSGVYESSIEADAASTEDSRYYLVVFARNGGKYDYGTTSGQVVLPMANEMDCEAAGLKISGNKEIHGKIFEHLRYVCLKGAK